MEGSCICTEHPSTVDLSISGLFTSCGVGDSEGKGIACSWQVDMLGVCCTGCDTLVYLEPSPLGFSPPPNFPLLILCAACEREGRGWLW